VTTNSKKFQALIDDISVSGGGDCPEMSVGAIKKALEVARPNSFFYVFTDAAAKDHHLQDEVLALIQRLQAQVGDNCDMTEDLDGSVFYKDFFLGCFYFVGLLQSKRE